MRRAVCVCLLMLAACGQNQPPPPLPAPSVTASATWFICDGVDAPAAFVIERDGDSVRITEYDKPNGATVAHEDYALGAAEAAAGSQVLPLLRGGQPAGAIHETNAMLETPAAAYTPRIAEIRLGERAISCRWLPRTRLFAITGRRSVAVHEDADGDLIYTTYDFAAPAAGPIELSEHGVSTVFSAEVRGGEERTDADGAEFRFSGADGYAYAVFAGRDGQGRLDVLRNGASVQSEDFIALQVGDGARD